VGGNKRRDLLHRADRRGVTRRCRQGSRRARQVRPEAGHLDPGDLQQPAPGLYGNLNDLSSTLYNKTGKHSLISVVGLQEQEAHVRRSQITYAPNPNPPSPQRRGHLDGAKCKK
jgi:hypothetical protein